jgi:F0F1-type ATP synthase assembly protein I
MSRSSAAVSPVRDRRGDVARQTRDVFRTLSMSSVGLEMGIAVILGLLAGRWLDDRAGTEPWLMLAGIGVGMAAGFKGLHRVLRQADRIAAENEAAAAAEAARTVTDAAANAAANAAGGPR